MAIDPFFAPRLAALCHYVHGADMEFDPAHERLTNAGKVERAWIIRPEGRDATAAALVADLGDRMVLAFQGTQTRFRADGSRRLIANPVLDWIQNFRIDLEAGPTLQHPLLAPLTGRVHRGFARETISVLPQAADILTKELDGRPLHLTGHSQGGAAALIAAQALRAAGVPVDNVYTFGAPRPGDHVFAASVTIPVYRCEFGDDVVPHMPPSVAVLDRAGLPLGRALGGLLDLIGNALPEELRAFTKTASVAAEAYTSIGRLTYRRPGGPLLTDLPPAEDDTLLRERLASLLTAGSNMVAHHSMDGEGHYRMMFG